MVANYFDPDTAADGTPYLTDEDIDAIPGVFWHAMEPGWSRDPHRGVWFGPTPYAPPPTRRTDYGRNG